MTWVAMRVARDGGPAVTVRFLGTLGLVLNPFERTLTPMRLLLAAIA